VRKANGVDQDKKKKGKARTPPWKKKEFILKKKCQNGRQLRERKKKKIPTQGKKGRKRLVQVWGVREEGNISLMAERGGEGGLSGVGRGLHPGRGGRPFSQ